MKFSVISYLDPESTAEVRKIQLKLRKITGSESSIKHWRPHVTIGDGIEVDKDKVRDLENDLRKVALSTEPLQIKSNRFTAITKRTGGLNELTTSYAIVLQVDHSDQLAHFVEHIRRDVTNYRSAWYQMPEPYTPHVTLAFRDLTKLGCETGIKYLQKNHQNIALSHRLDNISIAEHTTTGDPEYKRFLLSKNN